MHLSVESDPRELLSYETSIQRELRPGSSCTIQKLDSVIHRINHYPVGTC